jgi:hypothetical protein
LMPQTTTAFPFPREGRLPRLHYRGLLRLHLRCGPPICSNHLRDPLSPELHPCDCSHVRPGSYPAVPTTAGADLSSTG